MLSTPSSLTVIRPPLGVWVFASNTKASSLRTGKLSVHFVANLRIEYGDDRSTCSAVISSLLVDARRSSSCWARKGSESGCGVSRISCAPAEARVCARDEPMPEVPPYSENQWKSFLQRRLRQMCTHGHHNDFRMHVTLGWVSRSAKVPLEQYHERDPWDDLECDPEIRILRKPIVPSLNEEGYWHSIEPCWRREVPELRTWNLEIIMMGSIRPRWD